MKKQLITVITASALLGAPVAADAHGGGKKGHKVHRGTTTLALDATTAKALTDAGVALTAAKPATLANGKLALPATTGWAKKDGSAAEVKHVGGVTLTKGTTSVTLRNLKLSFGKTASFLTGKIGKGRIKVATLDTSAAKVAIERKAFSVTGVKAALTKEAADALNAAFATTLAEGAALGDIESATAPKKANPAPTPRPSNTKDDGHGKGKNDGRGRSDDDDKPGRGPKDS